MSARASLRSPVAIAWTLFAAVAVGLVVAAGWRLAVVFASSPLVTDPRVFGDLGALVIAFFAGSVIAAAAAVVWLPSSAAIAYAVGRRSRGQSATLSGSIGRIGSRLSPLYRWAKTRVAIDPIAERILTENDVAPSEIVVGCGGFVVPALALDASTLPSAVERANRIVPPPGRRRIQLSGLAGTALLAVGGGLFGVVADPVGAVPVALSPTLAAAGVVVGLVSTAAVETAWRARVYATADPDDGFSG